MAMPICKYHDVKLPRFSFCVVAEFFDGCECAMINGLNREDVRRAAHIADDALRRPLALLDVAHANNHG